MRRRATPQTMAHAAVARAIREGVLDHPVKCEACGRLPYTKPRLRGQSKSLRGLVWHHHDYAKPLDVIGLCRPCHANVHTGNLAEPRTGRIYPPAAPRRWNSRAIIHTVAGAAPDTRVPFLRLATRGIAEDVVVAHALRDRRDGEDWMARSRRVDGAVADFRSRLALAGEPFRAAS